MEPPDSKKKVGPLIPNCCPEHFRHKTVDWWKHETLNEFDMECIKPLLEDEIKYILELGCGRGRHTEALAKKGKKVDVVEINEDFIKIAKERVGEMPVAFINADIHHLPMGSNEYDGILCTRVFMHLEDEKKALSEMHRVLKKGGILSIDFIPKGIYYYKLVFMLMFKLYKYQYDYKNHSLREFKKLINGKFKIQFILKSKQHGIHLTLSAL
jgi:ubiquinone/menaquinone biosynthesis C-methylase UbiE